MSVNDESNPGSVLQKTVHHQKCHRLLEVSFFFFFFFNGLPCSQPCCPLGEVVQALAKTLVFSEIGNS